MQQLRRLVRYVFPYWSQLLSSILLMAAVGLLDAAQGNEPSIRDLGQWRDPGRAGGDLFPIGRFRDE